MTAPHDRPSASELLESVREWLERDVLTSVEGRLQFHTRVAINAMNIVLRELELGVEQETSHAEVMKSLGVASDRELAEAIRSGEFDNQLTVVLRVLKPVVEDKVRVANPGYLR
jgi:hypothetical protein